MKEGAAPVVVIDKKVYTITNPEKATDFAGERFYPASRCCRTSGTFKVSDTESCTKSIPAEKDGVALITRDEATN